MTSASFRPYRLEDFTRLWALEVVCFAPAERFSRATLKAFAEGESAACWIAEVGDDLAGFAIADVAEDGGILTGYLQTIEVAPQYRGQNIASGLLERLERSAVAAGAGVMTLHVSVNNVHAIRLYEKHGYKRLELWPGFYSKVDGDAFVYGKRFGYGHNGERSHAG